MTPDPTPAPDAALVEEVAQVIAGSVGVLWDLMDDEEPYVARGVARAVLATPALAARLATTGTTDEAAVDADTIDGPACRRCGHLRRLHGAPPSPDLEACWCCDAALAVSGPRTEPTDAVTALAAALYDVGLHSVGPDDLDNRQIAEGLIQRGWTRQPVVQAFHGDDPARPARDDDYGSGINDQDAS